MRRIIYLFFILASVGDCCSAAHTEDTDHPRVLTAYARFPSGEQAPMIKRLETASELCFTLEGSSDFLTCKGTSGSQPMLIASPPDTDGWVKHSSELVEAPTHQAFSNLISLLREHKDGESHATLSRKMREFIQETYKPEPRFSEEYQRTYVSSAPPSSCFLSWDDCKGPALVVGTSIATLIIGGGLLYFGGGFMKITMDNMIF